MYFDFPRVEKGRYKAGGNISCIHYLDGSHLDTHLARPARLSAGGTGVISLLSVNVTKSGRKQSD